MKKDKGKNVTFYLEEEIFKDFKKKCVELDKKFSDQIQELMEYWLRKKKDGE